MIAAERERSHTTVEKRSDRRRDAVAHGLARQSFKIALIVERLRAEIESGLAPQI